MRGKSSPGHSAGQGVNMDNPKRARSEKPRKQPRECAYVRSPDLRNALERIRQVACRDKGARFTRK